MITRVRKGAQEQRDELSKDTDPLLLSSRWVSLRQDYLDLGAQEALPGQAIDPDTPGDDLIGRTTGHRLSQAAAAQAERDAVAAVDLARIALTDAALAVLQAGSPGSTPARTTRTPPPSTGMCRCTARTRSAGTDRRWPTASPGRSTTS